MTTKTTLLQTIRKHCLECCGGSYVDVENCTAGPTNTLSKCSLWVYRTGKDPEEPSEAKRAAGARLAEHKKCKTTTQRKMAIKVHPVA